MSDIRVRVGQNNAIKVLSSASGGKALISENVIGGIADVNNLNVSGISTFNGNVYTNGNIYANNFVGIGTTNPTSKLTVDGDVLVSGVLTARLLYSSVYGDIGGSFNGTNIVGIALSISGISTFSGGPIFIGTATSTGTLNQKLQVNSGAYISGNLGVGTTNPQTKLEIGGTLGFSDGNIKIGNNSTGFNVIPSTNPESYSGVNNIFLGDYAGYLTNSGYKNNFIGHLSGISNRSGNFNNFLGDQSGFSNYSGHLNNFIGSKSGYNNFSGSKNIFIGNFSGISEIASDKIIFGSGFDESNLFDSPNTQKNTQFAVGIRTDNSESKYWLVGNENFNIGIGVTNPTSKLTVGGDGYFTGIVTASNFYVGNNLVGSGGSFANLYVSGVSTFIGDIIGSNASFSGNVTIGGTLTYEDVTNVDAIGLVTARNGARILSGGLEVVGVSTFSNLIDSNGGLNVVGGTTLDQLVVTGVSTLAILTVNNQFYYVPSYENGVAYFDASGLMVSTGSTSSSIDYTNYILTTDNLGIPVWSSVIDGGSY